MYILKNAITSIKRNKGRNFLIGIILIVIAISCTITLAIRSSANNIVTAYKEKNPIEATIEMDRRALMDYLRDGDKSQEEMINAFNEIKTITEEEIINYGDSEYVIKYYYTYTLGVDAKNLTEATDSLVKETTTTKTETTRKTRTRNYPSSGNMPPNFPGGGSGGSRTTSTTTKKTTTTKTEKIFNERAQDGAFTLIGYNSYEDMTDFINGKYTITSGEVSSDFESNNCVISEELATLNNLSVGDTITIVDPNTNSNTYELTITGIYKEESETSSDMTSMFTNSANNIITNAKFIKTILEKNSNLEATITPTFIIKDAESTELFATEVSEKGLSEYYKVTNNLEDIESATEVVNNVKIFATTFLIITLAIGGVVLIVINMINIRERKYEIGVLRTIGMKKSKVSIQFMSELLMVCIVSLLIGAGIGSTLSVPVSNMLLSNEIENVNSKYEDISNNFGMGRNKPENIKEDTSKTTEDAKEEETANTEESENNKAKEPEIENDEKYDFGLANISEVDSIDAVVDFKVLLELLGIGISLTLLSSLATMIAISRFSPLTILKERS
jgi:putative ABC transport system permease protein